MPSPARSTSIADAPGESRPRRFRLRESGTWIASALIVVLCSLHGLAIWWGLGGRAGLTNGWPLWRDDHPLYYHSALVTRSFLKIFMDDRRLRSQLHGGLCQERRFPVVVDSSRAGGRGIRRRASRVCLQDVCAGLGRGGSLVDRPGVRALEDSRRGERRSPSCSICSTSGPTSRSITSAFGMLPYFLAIPLGLAATGAFGRFLARGGVINWLICDQLLMSLAFLVHLTTAMVVVPAAALAYVAAVARRRGESPDGDGRSQPRHARAARRLPSRRRSALGLTSRSG